jgi:hypothetical protein
LHRGSFQQYPNAVRPIHHALLIISQIAQKVCELAHTTRIFYKPVLPNSLLLWPYGLHSTAMQRPNFLLHELHFPGTPTSASSTLSLDLKS